MKTYVIRLDTMQSLENYIYLLENYSFRGIVKVRHTCVAPADLLTLIDQIPSNTFLLQINELRNNDITKIYEYLKTSNLLSECEKIA